MAIEVTVNIGSTDLELQVIPGVRDVYFEGGAGDVVGPASAATNNLVKFADSTGKLVSDSTISVASVQNTISHVSATTGAHGMTAFGASVVAAANASAVRDLIDLNATDTPSFDEITVDTVNFDTTAAETAINEGELTWDNEEKTLYLGLANSAHIHLGQETTYYAENNTGSLISRGTLVCFAGTVGGAGKLRVTPWTGAQDSHTIIGIAGSDFAAGQGNPGVVVHFGKARQVPTTGSLYSESWSIGNILYAKPSGGLTKFKPTTSPIVTVAVVTSVHASNGSLRVRIDIGQTAAEVGAVALNANLNTLSSGNADAGTALISTGSGGVAWSQLTTSGSPVGDVNGPSSATDGHIVLFSGSSGKEIKTSNLSVGNAASKNVGTTAGTVAEGDHNHTTNQINLTNAVTGVLPATNGGTGVSSLGNLNASQLGSGAAANGLVLRANGSGGSSWSSLSVGSTDNAIVRADGTGGSSIQSSGITIADGASGTLSGTNTGDITVSGSVDDVLSVTGQELGAVDAGQDAILFWDDSQTKVTHLTLGSGLAITGTELSTSGIIGGSTGSTDNAILRADGTAGGTAQASGITIADGASGTLSGTNSGDVTLGASVADVFDVNSQVLSADDPGADRIVFWDESTNKLRYLTAGTGLTITDTTITASASSGVTAVGATATDVFSVSGSDLIADDAGADRLIFWDASASKLTYLAAGSGLSISGTTITATGSGVSAIGASATDVFSVSGSDLVADDPNADRLVFWDDSASKLTHMTAGGGLNITGTTLTARPLEIGGVITSSTSMANNRNRQMIRLDTSTGDVDLTIDPNSTTAYDDYFYCAIMKNSNSNIAQIIRGSGVELWYNGTDGDITLSNGVVWTIWRESLNVWRVIAKT